MHLAPHTLLQGRYRVHALIAQGGMGAVYRATDERLGNTVALKQTLVVDPQLRAAFTREARLLAGLHHPALPVVSDHFEEGGQQFLVMQYIPGDDLATLLRQRGAPFALDEVLPWADRLLDALDYLHTRRPPIIHRDVKPQNLKLTSRGELILLDFGLAKGEPAGATTPNPSLFGYTPQYAPLEQIQGSGTDARSDLYSVGATLYELLTGTPAPDALTRATAMVRGAPDPLVPAHALRPELPAAVGDLLGQALTLNPSQRPPSASAMRSALRAAVSTAAAPTGATPPAPHSAGVVTIARAATATAHSSAAPPVQFTAPPPATFPRSRPWVFGGAMVGLLLIILLGIVVWPDRPRRAPVVVPTPVGAMPVSTPASSDALAGNSLAAPVPRGEPGTFGGGELSVVETLRGEEAWRRMYAANQYNAVAPEGYSYLLVRLDLAAGPEPMPELYPRLVGTGRMLYAPEGVPPEPRLPEGLAPGENVEAWVPYLIPTGEQSLVLVVDSVAAGVDLDPVFLSVDAGARLPTDPELERIDPNRLGVDHREPAAPGETVITEDWELTVLDALRGPQVLEELVAAYARVERPAENHEYVLVKLEVRYIGAGGAVGYVSVGPFNLRSVRTTVDDPAANTIGHPPVYILPPDRPHLDARLYPGGTASGWTVIEVPAGDPDVALVFTPGIDPQGINTRYLALP